MNLWSRCWVLNQFNCCCNTMVTHHLQKYQHPIIYGVKINVEEIPTLTVTLLKETSWKINTHCKTLHCCLLPYYFSKTTCWLCTSWDCSLDRVFLSIHPSYDNRLAQGLLDCQVCVNVKMILRIEVVKSCCCSAYIGKFHGDSCGHLSSIWLREDVEGDTLQIIK